MGEPSPPVPVAFCITDLDAGGAERALVQIVTRLDRRRWDPTVICLSQPGPLVETLTQAGIPVTCLGAQHWSEFWQVWRLARQLRKIKPRILQTFLFHANVTGRLAGRMAGVRTIVSGIRVAERGAGWHLWLDRVTSRMVNHYVCVSQSVAEFSIERGELNPAKISVIPNGVEVDRFRNAGRADLTQFGIPNGSDTLLCIGRLDRQKGQALLIEAAQTIMPTHPHLHVLLVGRGPLEDRLRQQAAQTGYEARIHFAGWRDDVPELLAASSCVVVPSLWEGMANVVLEAMASAKPIIATRVEGMDALLQHESTGILISPSSVTELSQAISHLADDPHRGSELGRTAQIIAAEKFTWDSVVAQYEHLYSSLLHK